LADECCKIKIIIKNLHDLDDLEVSLGLDDEEMMSEAFIFIHNDKMTALLRSLCYHIPTINTIDYKSPEKTSTSATFFFFKKIRELKEIKWCLGSSN
jgi:hypothetical protein